MKERESKQMAMPIHSSRTGAHMATSVYYYLLCIKDEVRSILGKAELCDGLSN